MTVTVNTSPPLYQAIGSPIPIIWGSIRVNGVQLWASAPYSGGGIGNVVDVAVAWGTPLDLASGQGSNSFSYRLWGNSNLFYDASSGGSSVGALSFIDYNGSERQLPDPTLVLAQGAPGTPAFRGLIYTFFKGLPLSAFNNSISSTTFSDQLTQLATFGRFSLSTVIDKLAQRGGFPPGAFTITGVDDAHDGGQITTSTDFITLLQGFGTIYNFLILEHPLRLKRIPVGSGLTIDKTINESECIAASASDDVVLVSDAEPWTIPNQISLSYISAALSYQVATVPVKRPIFPFGLNGPLRIQTYSLPLVITDEEAANLAWLYLYRLWTQARTITFTAMAMHADVEPGDVIQITSQGVTYIAYVSRSTLKPDFSNAIIATALFTDATVALTADPGAVLPSVLVCPVTDWTTLDGASAVGTKVTNCGLLATCTTASGLARSFSFRHTGKYFFQAKMISMVYGAGIGVGEAGTDASTIQESAVFVQRNGFIYSNSVAQSYNLGVSNGGDVYSCAVDFDRLLFWVKLNSGNWNNEALADPAGGTFGISMSSYAGQPMSPLIGFGAPGNSSSFNFGQSSFVDRYGVAVPVPSGFTAGWPI